MRFEWQSYVEGLVEQKYISFRPNIYIIMELFQEGHVALGL